MRILGSEASGAVQPTQVKQEKGETGDLFGMLMQALLPGALPEGETSLPAGINPAAPATDVEDKGAVLSLEHLLALLSHMPTATAKEVPAEDKGLTAISSVIGDLAAAQPHVEDGGEASQRGDATHPQEVPAEDGRGEKTAGLFGGLTGEVPAPEVQETRRALSATETVDTLTAEHLPTARETNSAAPPARTDGPRIEVRSADMDTNGQVSSGAEAHQSARIQGNRALPPISSPSAAHLRAEILAFSHSPGRSHIELEVTPAGYGRISVSAQEHPDNRVTVRLVVESPAVKEAITAQIPRLLGAGNNVTVEVTTRAEAQEAESARNEGQGRGGRERQPERQARNEVKFEMQGVSDASR